MDEEELGSTGKKITIANFFESIKKIDKVADDALKSSKLNLGKIDVATEEIKKLQQIVASIQTDIQTLKDDDKIRRNELEDRLLEQQDALQKAQMIARQQELKGEKGDKGDQGEAGAPGQGEDRKNTPKPGGGGGGGFLQGLLGVGSIAAASIFNPLAALIGGNYGGMPVGQQRGEQGVTPSNNKVLETVNPFARLAGMFSRKKGKVEETGTGDDKKESGGMTPYDFIQQKGLKVTDVEDMFKRMVHVYNPDVQDKNGDYQGIKVSGTFQKKDDLSTEEFINAHPAFKISELKKIAKGRKKGKDKEGETKDGENIEPEKKENKLLDFVKKGGVAGFLGRKIFGKKDKENKPQENDATNPESTTFSESIQYSGRLDPETFKFIVDESSLEPGVPPEKAEQHYYQSKVEILEEDFKDDVVFNNMTREEAIEKYGPQSNLYRFKENYNNTLEYGGYELDVGKHYDFVKQSYSSSSKKDKKENKLMDFVKEGGVAGFLKRKLFGKKEEEEKGINTYSDGGGEVKEEKKENKIMNFVKGGGVAGFLSRKLFGEKEEKDEEKKSKREKVTYTDGGKTLTIDKGGFLDSLSKEDVIQKFTELNDRRIKAELAAKKGDKSAKLLSRKEQLDLKKLEIILEGKFKVNTRSIKSNVGLEIKGKKDEMNLIEVDPNFDFDDNPYEKKKSIQPIIESDNKNLQSNVFQPIDNNQIIVVESNGNQEASGTGNEAVRVPANQPNTQDSGELVPTDDASNFLKAIKNEQLNISNSVLPHLVAQNLK